MVLGGQFSKTEGNMEIYPKHCGIFMQKILMMISSSLPQALPSKEGLDYSGTCCRNDRRLFVDLLESEQ